ncbi:hypothetical protein ACIQJT_02335 [Streptomyces sp. NPDC091972]|uniref:hypothetical protein n=1 Tax=Streptomyces sp. NPDC091972 TaxID=3366007 RepID=UPI003810F77E
MPSTPYPIPRPPAPNGYGTCPDCHARVLYCLTDSNRRTIAVEPEADPTGNQAVRVDTQGLYWARQLSKARPAVEQREVLRRPHIASLTCPAALRARATRARRTTGRARTGVRPTPWRQR